VNGAGRLATSGVAWGFAVSTAIVFVTLFGLDGRAYYSAPLATRGYEAAHRILKPSGPVGQTYGVIGTVLMLVPFMYMARKRIRKLSAAGSARAWLEIHLFCGIVGPALVTLHTSFKFNGIVSAAYWSMVIVVASGFLGRYLYVRIPRSIRGNELTRAELDAQAQALKEELAGALSSPDVMADIGRFEGAAVPVPEEMSSAGLLFGEISLKRKLRALDRELERHGADAGTRGRVVELTARRSLLLRRAVYLERTKKLFQVWHVFHLPLVYLLLFIAAAHIGVALYMGYVPFRW
jgi:hypothetical protein